MKFKKETIVLFLTATIFMLLGTCAWLLLSKMWIWAACCVPFIVYFLGKLIKVVRQTDIVVMEFIESIKYKDYSRYYNTNTRFGNMDNILTGLNYINDCFRNVTKEKSTENIYLQKILEMVNIGLLVFDVDTGEIHRLNDAFRKITGIPYFKNIDALEKRNMELWQLVKNIKTTHTEIIKIKISAQDEKLLINATIFKTGNNTHKLISLQNIEESLDETESKAWQKLLNVMTHEIMNSVAPIASLADTLKTRLADTSIEQVTHKEDLNLGLETIKKRSEGLQRFAITYRNLNTITKPQLKKILVSRIFENIQDLMQPTFDQKNIEFTVLLKEPHLIVEADMSLLEQVLINLITNAIEAVKGRPEAAITVSAYLENEKTKIKVADNGIGIPSKLTDQIFVPFFSSRKNGNGIGLSLCKQIMLLHKGNIHVQTEKGKGTAFILHL